jgi:hypothetical protein
VRYIDSFPIRRPTKRGCSMRLLPLRVWLFAFAGVAAAQTHTPTRCLSACHDLRDCDDEWPTVPWLFRSE